MMHRMVRHLLINLMGQTMKTVRARLLINLMAMVRAVLKVETSAAPVRSPRATVQIQ